MVVDRLNMLELERVSEISHHDFEITNIRDTHSEFGEIGVEQKYLFCVTGNWVNIFFRSCV